MEKEQKDYLDQIAATNARMGAANARYMALMARLGNPAITTTEEQASELEKDMVEAKAVEMAAHAEGQVLTGRLREDYPSRVHNTIDTEGFLFAIGRHLFRGAIGPTPGIEALADKLREAMENMKNATPPTTESPEATT